MVRDEGRGRDYKKERDLTGNGKVLYPDFSIGYTHLQVITWHGIIYTLYIYTLYQCQHCGSARASYITCNHWGELDEGYTGLLCPPLCTILLIFSEPIVISK